MRKFKGIEAWNLLSLEAKINEFVQEQPTARLISHVVTNYVGTFHSVIMEYYEGDEDEYSTETD